ncbi:MAG: hypothetical protein KBT12_08985 [Bacteroidales bacterium]|nr:hypothetical protein [Candidatus Physcousia equi]
MGIELGIVGADGFEGSIFIGDGSYLVGLEGVAGNKGFCFLNALDGLLLEVLHPEFEGWEEVKNLRYFLIGE